VKFLIFLIITQTALATPTLEVEEAKKSLLAMIRPLLTNSKQIKESTLPKDFQLQGCDKHKINWMNVILMKEEAELKYVFKTGCDVEGTINPRIFRPFPVDLKLRNLASYHKISTQNTITASFESRPIMLLEMTAGELTGPKGVVKFEADYRVQLNPMNKENPVEKNLGGEIRISEIYGKKASIKEKILVK
jgi:hypothetical protein